MRNIRLEMTKGSNTLELQGELYEAPIRPDDEPVRAVKRVRRDVAAGYRVDPGSYSFRFDVSTGSGKYTLEAFQGDADVSFASGSFDTADGRTLVQFKFTVI
ncbi:hypothetical protein JRI60_01840 [Archangium violaceum]|uniref:hypothetical protein n=1 Tax=Archangium violaceum TaxID=83451 RepID=UPI00194F5693|nr:hypothetical protein [Archangium violaceum]QRN97852.1 hypothetical protein JRI60_01840 [Archangium violaceum]